MFNALLGWYCRENLGARTIQLVWEETLLPNETGDYTLQDAINGLQHITDLQGNDYLLYDVFAYGNPGFVKVEVLPDNTSGFKFTLEATPKGTRTPLPIPVLIENDITLSIENDAAANDLYVSFNGIRLSSQSLAQFTLLSEIIFQHTPNATIEILKTLKEQQGIAYSATAVAGGVPSCKKGGGGFPS